jgi:hypothetical protein
MVAIASAPLVPAGPRRRQRLRRAAGGDQDLAEVASRARPGAPEASALVIDFRTL